MVGRNHLVSRRQFVLGVSASALSYSLTGFSGENLTVQTWARPYFHYRHNYKFINAHTNIQYRMERYYRSYNHTENNQRVIKNNVKVGLDALESTLKDAEFFNRPIAFHGGKWSLSETLKVGRNTRWGKTRRGFLVDTRGFNFTKINIDRNLFDSNFVDGGGDYSRICFVQTGCSVRDLNTYLESHGSALPTSGASDGQTFIGAMLTGTHGAALKVGAMQDYVKALLLMPEPGKKIIVQKSSNPVVNQSMADFFDAELVNDDELFLAAVVSFGAFGLVGGAFIQAIPLYKLHSTLSRHDFVEVSPAIQNLDPSWIGKEKDPYHFEVIMNPYGVKNGDRGAFVQVMKKLPGHTLSTEPRPPMQQGAGGDILELVSLLTALAPAAIPSQVGGLVENDLRASRGDDVIWTPGMTFTGLPVPGHTIATEVAIPLKHASKAIEKACQIAEEYPYPGVIATRYLKPTEAYMGFTRFGEITCTIELGALNNHRSRNYFSKFWKMIKDENIPFTWHWGQMNEYDDRSVREKFGTERINKWINARRRFLTPRLSPRFTNEVLHRCKLI